MARYIYTHHCDYFEPVYFREFDDFLEAVAFGAKHSSENEGIGFIMNPDPHNPQYLCSFREFR